MFSPIDINVYVLSVNPAYTHYEIGNYTILERPKSKQSI